MFNLIWKNFAISVIAAFFGGILSLVISGEHIGNVVFWANTVLLTLGFTLADLIRINKKKKDSV